VNMIWFKVVVSHLFVVDKKEGETKENLSLSSGDENTCVFHYETILKMTWQAMCL